MNLQIRLVAIADNGPEQVHEIASLQRTELKLETLGLTLAEGKTILREIQRVLVERQVAECLAPYRHCAACGQPQRGKGQHDLPMRTVFGKMAIPSPRTVYCECQPHETKRALVQNPECGVGRRIGSWLIDNAIMRPRRLARFPAWLPWVRQACRSGTALFDLFRQLDAADDDRCRSETLQSQHRRPLKSGGWALNLLIVPAGAGLNPF